MGGLHVLYSRQRYERIPEQEADKEQKSAETIVPKKPLKDGRGKGRIVRARQLPYK